MAVSKSEILANKYNLGKTEADELYELLIQMSRMNFLRSRQLSKCIVTNRLGYKYPNISGVVRMQEGSDEWDFHGGFPPIMYKIICEELNLNNEGTPARAVGFKSFKALENGNQKTGHDSDNDYEEVGICMLSCEWCGEFPARWTNSRTNGYCLCERCVDQLSE